MDPTPPALVVHPAALTAAARSATALAHQVGRAAALADAVRLTSDDVGDEGAALGAAAARFATRARDRAHGLAADLGEDARRLGACAGAYASADATAAKHLRVDR